MFFEGTGWLLRGPEKDDGHGLGWGCGLEGQRLRMWERIMRMSVRMPLRSSEVVMGI